MWAVKPALTTNATESGASLQQKALAPKDPYLKRLAETVRDRDLWWNKTPDSETLASSGVMEVQETVAKIGLPSGSAAVPETWAEWPMARVAESAATARLAARKRKRTVVRARFMPCDTRGAC